MNTADTTALRAVQQQLAHTLLTSDSAADKRNAVQQLYTIYSSITGVTADMHSDAPVGLSTGIAISSGAAAHCLLEFARTSAFLRGIHHAIHDLQQKHPGERIRIVYAGCGPYATLITPLLDFFLPSDIRVDLIEVIPRSLDAVQKLHSALGVSDYITGYQCCDATKVCITGDEPVRLLISETLNAGLRNEPFLAIMQNLVPQLAGDAIVIPQQIIVEAAFIAPKEEIHGFIDPAAEKNRMVLGTLAQFSKTNPGMPAPVILDMPVINTSTHQLHLLTRIDVYEGEWLNDYDCSLTLPAAARLTDTTAGDGLQFTYRTGARPGFVVEVLKAGAHSGS